MILNWFINNWIELSASILGLIGIFLQIKQNPWYWFTSIIMVILYIYVFYYAKFYADMSFQFYYLGVSIYGWIYWVRTKNKNRFADMDKSQDKRTYGEKGKDEETNEIKSQESRYKNKENKINAKKLSSKKVFFAIGMSVLFWILIYLILRIFTNSDIPIGDSFTTALSIVATFLLARKFVENWIFWIIVDFVSTILYIYKGLYPTAILFMILTILAFVGYFEWRKSL
ncbi:MAG: nicotinamide riboside transporter PnuC [Bacteroidales bacterium]|jgi:nicotinamide mononucleotide transporter|nr:nicotinamide riboside transporter PnuC [Bacteroidales bacterium]